MQDKVLIIEDSPSFAAIVKQILLDRVGIESDVVASKQDAEQALAEDAKRYIVAIVDLNLPDAPRGEATESVVAAKIPAVVFTSTNDQAVKDDLWERGITDYAHKSGAHSLDYICWIVDRLRKNDQVRVLVVDDSKAVLRSMAKLLKTQRYQVHIAGSGDEALEILHDYPDIRVAVLDCFMDGMDGFELTSKIRETHSRDQLGIIGVSSNGGRSISAQFIKSGANDYLLKPFIPEEFLCRVNHSVERVESFEQLIALNQTKNQLLGTAAHDIRGPVGAIKTAADYILKRDPAPERKQHLVKMIESSAGKLLDLLSDILDVSAIEGGELQLKRSQENIAVLIEERVQLYLAQAESKNITVHSNFKDDIQVFVDRVKILQVVDNLLTNAIKYSPQGGEVHVYAGINDDTFTLRVEDSGQGISEQEQRDLFVPFKVLSSTATAGEKATGLGLAIVKNVVQAHGGNVGYEDSSLGGAAFIISLPRSE